MELRKVKTVVACLVCCTSNMYLQLWQTPIFFQKKYRSCISLHILALYVLKVSSNGKGELKKTEYIQGTYKQCNAGIWTLLRFKQFNEAATTKEEKRLWKIKNYQNSQGYFSN